MHQWRRILGEESGATAVEYAFILGAIILVAVATVERLGTASKKTFQTVDEALVVP